VATLTDHGQTGTRLAGEGVARRATAKGLR
jgi:hypothetical protein